MHRRNILTAALAGASGLFAAAAVPHRASAAASPDKAKVVYHLSDLDKVAFRVGQHPQSFRWAWAGRTR